MVSIGMMVADHRYQHLQSVRSVMSIAITPIHYLADFPASTVHWFSEVFATRGQLHDDNDDLHRQNLLLRAQLQKLDALEAENMRLRDLLKSSFRIGDRILIAELLSVDLDPFRQQVIINKGSRDNVFEGQPVLDANAVMGQVIRLNPLNATVLLITDPSHGLPVQVNRNGLRTIAFGTGRVNQLVLPQLPNNADIREGDLLVTSGLGGHFPPGYPVATVSSVRQEPGRPFASVTATPSAHLERTREVLLVWTRRPDWPESAETDQEISATNRSGDDQTP